MFESFLHRRSGIFLSPVTFSRALGLSLLIALSVLMMPEWAYAAVDGQCNTDPKMLCPGGPGCPDEKLIAPIIENIKETVDESWGEMYDSVLGKMQTVAAALMMLYVIVVGLLFTLGMVQFTVSELATRTVKLVLIAVFLQSTASFLGGGCSGSYFDCTVKVAFRDGTDSIIESMTSAMVSYLGGAGVIDSIEKISGDDGTFKALDDLVLRLISPGTMMIWAALFSLLVKSSAPAAGLVLLSVIMSLIYLMVGIARAVWVYIVALLATTLLFGLGPIFICFALFERTKSLFDGWLGQLINFSLQPILMFTFMTFFAVLMQTMLLKMTDGVQVCVAHIDEPVKGAQTSTLGLVFANGDGIPLEVDFDIDGLKCKVPGEDALTKCADFGVDFPVDPIQAIAFMLVAYIAFSFYDHVISVANEISGAFIDLELGSPVRNMTDAVSQRIGNVSGDLLSGKAPNEILRNNGLGFLASSENPGSTPPPPKQ